MRSLILFVLNNFVVNQVLILIGYDGLIKRFQNNWALQKINPNKTLQENVGFSHGEAIDEAIKTVHKYVQETEERYLPNGGKVLDIGCGVGLYLKELSSSELYGTDLNDEFLKECQKQIPHAQLFKGDYNKLILEANSFDFIYSISVIEYISPSQISGFFVKINKELKHGGIMLIQYPHALSIRDRLYFDLSYVPYLPERLEKIVSKNFDILLHEHSFDGRKVRGIDKKNYAKNGGKSFCNGMVMIARKR